MGSIRAGSIVFFMLSALCFAKSSGIERGGLGFIYSDHNSFSNPGHFGGGQGFAMDGRYNTSNANAVKGVTSSAVFGNGSIGVGAFGSRVGSDLTTAGSFSDTVGAGMGMGLAKGKVLAGVGYQKGLTGTQPNNGIASVSLMMKNEKGYSLAAGGTTELSATDSHNDQTGTVGIGYSFNGGYTFEVDATFNDLADTSDLTGAAYITKNGQSAYVSVGYLWYNTVSHHGASTRIGFMLGKSVDLSFNVTHEFVSGANPSYGGALRFAM